MEDTADLDAHLVVGDATRGARHRRPGTRPSGLGLAGRLLVGAVIAVAAIGTTITVAHTASARRADSIFVTPGASTIPTPSPDATGAPSAGVVLPPVTDQAGAVQSQGPDASGYLNDGLSEDPGQPSQQVASQDPHSNG